MKYKLLKGINLGDSFDETNNPKDFRLLKIGDNELTKDGENYNLHCSRKQLEAIAAYQKNKGEKIPIDSRHALLEVAQQCGVEESTALKMVPGKIAALGFCDLVLKDDGLYASNIELSTLASELFKKGYLRYYSPTIRGLDGGSSQLRISSVAMDNVPALNNLDILAATAEYDKKTNSHNNLTRKELIMTKTEIALRNLFGDSALALSDSNDSEIAKKIEALGGSLG